MQPNGVPDRWVILAASPARRGADREGRVGAVSDPAGSRRGRPAGPDADREHSSGRIWIRLEEADGVQGLLISGSPIRMRRPRLGWSLQKVRRQRKIAALPPPVKARIDALNPEVPVTLARCRVPSPPTPTSSTCGIWRRRSGRGTGQRRSGWWLRVGMLGQDREGQGVGEAGYRVGDVAGSGGRHQAG